MELDSARELKQRLIADLVVPFTAQVSRLRNAGAMAIAAASEVAAPEAHIVFGVGARPFDRLPEIQRSIALGIATHEGQYRLAVRVQRPSLMNSPLIDHLTQKAKGEVDVRLIGRIDKRARRLRAAVASPRARATHWYQGDTRPLQIGASVGHVKVTAGTIGGFVKRGGAIFILSNNHVLANEDRAHAGDWILQRAAYDGGRQPAERVARLRVWIRLVKKRANFVDCALGRIQPGVQHDASLLRGLVRGADRKLAGLGPEFVDQGDTVHKVGRTTGATEGRVTAFDLDNVVVNYDTGNLRFDGQIEIEGAGNRAFSDGGDSGSLIVSRDMQAVALLFAGGDSGGSNGLGLTYANPIHRVLKDLKATLLW